ncbi:MAG: methylmalonyl Co-A mutase-associated GTPase MeaB [Cyclobacteriaceae bacterium]|jgi:LAO/AO transport system kinase|nr:methylmalonyl Co-A mutase-associated GTPase MeaB [Cyclobacteriaceae bacterium]
MQSHPPAAPGRLTLAEYIHGIRSGNTPVLSRAITLMESQRPTDQALAEALVEALLPFSGHAFRLAITGVPGVGKSTFIEALGQHVTNVAGKKIAVLTIDPSSQRTHGSILGDKTRMDTLTRNPRAFIRPSASGEALNGVAHGTREAMVLCEAAGYEVIVIETVGIGQLEAGVRSMVDFFILLLLAGAGDELQGIKKGILEMADALVLTKADGDNLSRIRQAKTDLLHALHLFPLPDSGWKVPVLTTSALTGEGIADVWQQAEHYRAHTQRSGFFDLQREHQAEAWFAEAVQRLIYEQINRSANLKQQQEQMNALVKSKKLSAPSAARQLMKNVYPHDRE